MMFLYVPEPPPAQCGDGQGRGHTQQAFHATEARAPHRRIKVHAGDAATSSFKGLVGLQMTCRDRGKDT